MDRAEPAPQSVDRAGRWPDVVSVYREHAQFVWRSLQRMGVDDAHLEDLTQDVFLVVHRRLHTFDNSARMTTWLYGICIKVVSGWRRRAWYRRESAVAQVPEASVEADAADEWMAHQEAQRKLRAVLDKMDLDKRAVFVMFEVEEMSTREIAAELDLPVGTVHSRLHAAREQFQLVLSRLDAKAFRGSDR